MSEVIPLLSALTRLWDATYDRVRSFPKLDKHLIGTRLLDDLDACTIAVLLALSNRTHRFDHLAQAAAHFDRAKLRIRIAVRRAIISERWYASQLDALADIGRQLGGWQRAPPPQRSEHHTAPRA